MVHRSQPELRIMLLSHNHGFNKIHNGTNIASTKNMFDSLRKGDLSLQVYMLNISFYRLLIDNELRKNQSIILIYRFFKLHIVREKFV